MSESKYLVPIDQRPSWLDYPHSFKRMVGQTLTNLTPWHIMESNEALKRFEGLKERYPNRNLFPFAYRQDNDDVACWASGEGEKVYIIHDFASSGWEDEQQFPDIWSWFRSAIEETIDWD